MPADWSRVARRVRVPMGFVFAGIYIWLAHPTFISMAWSLVLVLPGLWLRGYAAGYVKKNAELTVTGPYAYTRNPLYLGSLLIGIGFAIAARSWWIALLLVVMFFAIYVPVIRSEEAFLREKFPEFDDYTRRVPRMLPRLIPARIGADGGGFSFDLYLKHREWNALLGAIAIVGVLIAKMMLLH